MRQKVVPHKSDALITPQGTSHKKTFCWSAFKGKLNTVSNQYNIKQPYHNKLASKYIPRVYVLLPSPTTSLRSNGRSSADGLLETSRKPSSGAGTRY